MEIIASLERFVLSDPDTLVKVLFLGNLFFALVVAMYSMQVEPGRDRRRFGALMLAKALQGLGWMAFAFVRVLPSVFSLNFGQGLLCFGLYIESLVMLGVARAESRPLQIVQAAIAACAIAILNIASALRFDFLVVAALGAYSEFAIMVIPGVAFLVKARNTPLRRLIGFLYVLMFLVSLARAGEIFSLHAQGVAPYVAIINSASLLLFVLNMHVGGTALFLALKEDADAKIAELAYRDPLTGLFNRRHFLEEGRAAVSRSARARSGVSVIFFDLDHFKAVNDQYGHNFGDEVLRDFASVLRLHVRTCDIPCRYGGEEFVVLLPDTDAPCAVTVAERVRAYLSSSKFPNKTDFNYTVSAGVSSRVPGPTALAIDELHALILESDQALYRAKGSGRDRVVTHENGAATEKQEP